MTCTHWNIRVCVHAYVIVCKLYCYGLHDGFAAVFERLRTILHEAQIDKRVQYMIEVMFAVRKDGFKVKIRYYIPFSSVNMHLEIVAEFCQLSFSLPHSNLWY